MNGTRRSVAIDDEVYEQIAARGKFGETANDVLRSVFGLEGNAGSANPAPEPITPTRGDARTYRPIRRRLAERPISVVFENGEMVCRFGGGPERRWQLPNKSDSAEIRRITREAKDWAEANGGTVGQRKAIAKELNKAGYFIYGPRSRR